MTLRNSATVMVAAACVVGLFVGARGSLQARQALASPHMATSAGLDGLLASSLVFAADANKDGAVTRDELKAAMEKWFADADAAKRGVRDARPAAAGAERGAAAHGSGGAADGRRTRRTAADAGPGHVRGDDGRAARARRRPSRAQPRKVLVLAKAAGFVHSSIPLAAKTIEALGTKTGAWSTTITYDAADITADNLKQYDAVFLASTTGAFLDDPDDAAVTAARRQALLDFVRGGKGLAGIHAATDSYHAAAPAPAAALAARRGGARRPAPRRRTRRSAGDARAGDVAARATGTTIRS